MREPDEIDSGRILALILAAIGTTWTLGRFGLMPGWLVGALNQPIFGLVPLLYARKAGLRPFAASGFSRISIRQAALVLVASAGTFWILKGFTDVQLDLFRMLGLDRQAHAEEQMIQRGVESMQKRSAIAAFSLLAILPPICEEIAFRGIAFRGLLRRFGMPVSAVVTAILFAVLHGTMVQTGLMIFLGMYFALIVHFTGSLWASVIAHAVNNAVVLGMMMVFGSEVTGFAAPWWMYPLSAVVFGLAMTMLALERKAPPPPAGPGGVMAVSDRR